MTTTLPCPTRSRRVTLSPGLPFSPSAGQENPGALAPTLSPGGDADSAGATRPAARAASARIERAGLVRIPCLLVGVVPGGGRRGLRGRRPGLGLRGFRRRRLRSVLRRGVYL